MNERIRELAVQAYKEAAALGGQGVISMSSVREVQLEKFAKLLIHECAYTARQCYTVRGVDAEDVARHIEETFFGAKQ